MLISRIIKNIFCSLIGKQLHIFEHIQITSFKINLWQKKKHGMIYNFYKKSYEPYRR